jgi:hypothetical protein
MVGFVLLITLLLFANGNDIYKSIIGKKKKKKLNFYLHKSNDSLSLHRFTTETHFKIKQQNSLKVHTNNIQFPS